MTQPHWTDAPVATATSALESAKAAMRKTILRPVGHGPPVRQVVTQAIAAPQTLPADSRAALMSKLYEKYGERASAVAPYIVGEPAPVPGQGM